MLGLAFKPNTDDTCEAPAIDIIRWVTNQGAAVRVYHPIATKTGREPLEREEVHLDRITFCESAYEVADGADALVVVTEWNEFLSLDMLRIRSAMRYPVLIDGRNIYDAAEMNRLGFNYLGIGRGTSSAPIVLPQVESTRTL